MENTDQIRLSLPAELHQQLKDKASKNQKNVEDLLLEMIQRELGQKKEAYPENDEEKVKERLKSLGYMD